MINQTATALTAEEAILLEVPEKREVFTSIDNFVRLSLRKKVFTDYRPERVSSVIADLDSTGTDYLDLSEDRLIPLLLNYGVVSMSTVPA